MANSVRGRGVIDLRKRKPGPVQEKRRTLRLALPAHRKSSLRTRHRKLQALLALIAVIIGAGIVYGVSALTYLPQFAVTEVSIGGAKNIPPRLVQAFIETQLHDGSYHLLSRENIFLYPKADIAKSIPEYFPRILSAQISRESLLAQAITVSIVERKPFALWCEGATCFEMDESGFIFIQTASTTSAGGVVFTGGLASGTAPIGETFLPKHFEDVLALLARLQDQGFPAISVSVENEQDFAVSLSSGFVLRASFGADAATLVRNLEDVLSSDALRGKVDKIEYIDLRFGNRVYYKNR